MDESTGGALDLDAALHDGANTGVNITPVHSTCPHRNMAGCHAGGRFSCRLN
jgi:hypothetical protein